MKDTTYCLVLDGFTAELVKSINHDHVNSYLMYVCNQVDNGRVYHV